MRLLRVDPPMCGCMYAVEAVVQRRESLVENQELTEGIVYTQIEGFVNGRALIHNSLALIQCSGEEQYQNY